MIGRRPCWPKLVPLRPPRSPLRRKEPLVMKEFQQPNGRGSLRSNTQVRGGVHFSTALLVAGSVTVAVMLIYVWSAGRSTHGMEITEQLLKLLQGFGLRPWREPHQQIQLARMTLLFRRRPVPTLRRNHGYHGMTCPEMFIKWLRLVHGSWRSSQVQQGSRNWCGKLGSHACHRSM